MSWDKRGRYEKREPLYCTVSSLSMCRIKFHFVFITNTIRMKGRIPCLA